MYLETVSGFPYIGLANVPWSRCQPVLLLVYLVGWENRSPGDARAVVSHVLSRGVVGMAAPGGSGRWTVLFLAARGESRPGDQGR